MNRPDHKSSHTVELCRPGLSCARRHFLQALAVLPLTLCGREGIQNWPRFRGTQGRGIADGFSLRTTWNADPEAGASDGIKWRSEIPGLGHSSPILWNDRIYLATAIAQDGPAPLKLTPGGAPAAAEDHGEQKWDVICIDKHNGRQLWHKTARQGRPRASRHMKATHANSTLATDGNRLVVFFGSEGLYCFDLDGRLLWERDLGVIDISKYGIGWGYASSPTLFNDRIVLVCDDPKGPFVICLALGDGRELWRVSREGISERSWSTPLIAVSENRTQVVVNGWPWIVSYDLESGRELWRLSNGGDNPTPSPFLSDGWIYMTSAHGGPSPIFVVRPEASGDISPQPDAEPNPSLVWNHQRGGSYMSTPVVYGDYLYFGNTNSIVRSYHAKTGKRIYEERLDQSRAAVYASLVAGDGKIFCPSENGSVYVLEAGPNFKILSRNPMGEACYATPIISQGVLYLRTTGHLVAIK